MVPILLFLLFGIIEFGFLLKNRAELEQAAREGARAAAVGATLSRINAEIDANTTSINDLLITRTFRYRSWDENTNSWSDWAPLSDDGSENNASQGDQIEIRLSYSHHLLIPGLMGRVMGADENGNVTLEAATVMMRE